MGIDVTFINTSCFQQPYMLSAIRELADKRDFSESHTATGDYLDACNRMFETGILSHSKIIYQQSHVLVNLHTGFNHFFQWHEALQASCPGT